jgi:hypothetical protein
VSKFEEMLQASALTRKQWSRYRERTYTNLSKLVNGFVTYVQIPRECISFRPLDKEPEDGWTYNLIGATHYKDGFWNLGLCVTLSNQPITPSSGPRLLLAISMKERDGKVLVKRYLTDKPRTLNLDDENQCNEFYENIVDDIKKFYEQSLPDSDDTPNSIGFTIEFGSPD